MLYMTSRAVGTPLALCYYLSLVVLGSFYLLNLFLAVMWHVNNRPPPPKRKGKKAPKAWWFAAAEDNEGGLAPLAAADGASATMSAAAAPPGTAAMGGGACTVPASLPGGMAAMGGGTLPTSLPGGSAGGSGASRLTKRRFTISLQVPKKRASTPPSSERRSPAPLPLSQRFSTPCERLVNARAFQLGILGLIVLTTALMTLDHYPMDPALAAFLEGANVLITALFALEMACKHCAFGYALAPSVVVVGLGAPAWRSPAWRAPTGHRARLAALCMRASSVLRVREYLRATGHFLSAGVLATGRTPSTGSTASLCSPRSSTLPRAL